MAGDVKQPLKMTIGMSPEEKRKLIDKHNFDVRNDSASYTPADTELKEGVKKDGAESVAHVGVREDTPSGVKEKTQRELETDEIAPVKATGWESFGAGIGGFGTDVYRSVRSARIHEYDPQFNHTPVTEEFFKTHGTGTPEEIKYLANSKSFADWQERTGYVLDNRYRAQAIADNPIRGILGSLIDVDLPVAAIPIVGQSAKATTAVRAAQRVGAGAVGFGSVAAIQSAQEANTLRSEEQQMMDRITFGLARMVAPYKKAANLTGTPSISTQAAQRMATNIDNELARINSLPTGTPAQQVARNKIVAQLQSTADELRYYTQGDDSTVVNKLLSNPAFNNGDDVVSAQNAYWYTYDHKLMAVEDRFKDAIIAAGVKPNFFNRVSGRYGKARDAVGEEFQDLMQKLDSDVMTYYRLNGVLPDDAMIETMLKSQNKHPSIENIAREYINSGFAQRVYDDAHASGLFTREVVNAQGVKVIENGMDDIVRRPTYMPLRHDYGKIMDTVNVRKIATMDEVAQFVGGQIARMYPDLLKPKNAAGTFVLTEQQIGKHFLQTQKTANMSINQVAATGLNKEQLTDILTQTGNLTDKDARIIAADIYDTMHKQGTSVPKHLRRRIEWDWGATVRTSSGHNLSMRDLVSSNALGNLEDYGRNMAHRIGLSDYGLKSESELVNLLESYLEKLPQGVDVQKARDFMANTTDVLMGRSVQSGHVPEGIRGAQAIADLFLLANSGLYNMIDIATQMQKVGVMRSFPAVKQGMKAMFGTLKKFNATEAKELEDILTGKLLAGSRWKHFHSRYADNFAVGTGLSESAQYYGQSARFINLSESLKRFQVGTLASVYVSTLKKAMSGSAKDLKFMRDKLKMSDELIQEIQAEYAKHGTKIDNWSNGTRVSFEQKIFHDADNLAMNIHRGEVPAVLEHSAVGRIIFPYMRYAFGMQNKVLRRTLERDGKTGLAMLMAVQIPTAMLVAAAINVRKGEEPDKDLLVQTIRSMSALGSLNYPLEIALAGLDGGGVTALAPFGKTYKFGKEIATGGKDGEIDLRTLKTNSPINAAVPVDLLLLALED